MASWPLHEAKARLSEVVSLAMSEGRQRITRHGRPAVVVIAETELARIGRPEPEMSFREFLLTAPQVDDDSPFEVERIHVEPHDLDVLFDDDDAREHAA